MNYAHNDLHPRNLLFDERLNLKLTDFDSCTKIGDDYLGAPPPYARVLNDGPDQGCFGYCGARTEQFAIGSILYIMLYGHEPFENTDIDSVELVDRFRFLQLPELRNGPLQNLVWKCWLGKFPTIKDLEIRNPYIRHSQIGAGRSGLCKRKEEM